MRVLSILFLCLISLPVLAQNSGIKWSRCYGGSGDEIISAIKRTVDNGYIIVGQTNSYDGNVVGYHGKYSGDIWVLKLNASFNIEWQKTLGGTKPDYAGDVKQTADGGYVIAGSTISDDGDVTGNHLYEYDVWIIKLTYDGKTEWQRSLGGTGFEQAAAILQTSDGGYIFTGNTNSEDGDVYGLHSVPPDETIKYGDMWVVKLSSTGNIEWQKTIGGTRYEYGYAISKTADGNYIIAGMTSSNDGNVVGPVSTTYIADALLVKIDIIGNILWQKRYGGSGYNRFTSISATFDGGYIAGGMTYENPIPGHHGDHNEDMWIVKLDDDGKVEWQKPIGGSGYDNFSSIEQTVDSGYVITGSPGSDDGDLVGYTFSDKNENAWFIKLSAIGNIQYQKIVGGPGKDRFKSVIQLDDTGYILAGSTSSSDVKIIDNHGKYDFWILQLDSNTVSHFLETKGVAFAENTIRVYPNPSRGDVTIELPAQYKNAHFSLINLMGQSCDLNLDSRESPNTIKLQYLPIGLYLLQVITENMVQTYRIIIQR